MSTDDLNTGAMHPVDVPQEDTMTTPTISSHDEPPAAMAAAPAPAPARAGRQVRVGTIVWGLVIAAIGAFILAYALGADFDAELAFIILIAGAGVLLLVGTVANSLRRKG